MTYTEAQAYCGYPDPEQGRLSGLGQLMVLLKDGLRPEHKLLEIGAGCLNLYQFARNYCYPYLVEPNLELVDAGIEALGMHKQVPVSSNSNFRFRYGGNSAYIFAHSVLSHVSDRQLAEFMAAVQDQLAPNGVCLASIRLNFHQNCDHWAYPEPRHFSLDQVLAAAGGLKVQPCPDYRDIMMMFNKSQVHDWLRITL